VGQERKSWKWKVWLKQPIIYRQLISQIQFHFNYPQKAYLSKLENFVGHERDAKSL
jgi:hypothetical protein